MARNASQWRATMAGLNDGLQCLAMARNDGSQWLAMARDDGWLERWLACLAMARNDG
jgi:hypothetical protein